MEYIIQQLALDFVKNILEKATLERLFDMDGLLSDMLDDCKGTVREMFKVILENYNEQIRQNKQLRKELGLVLQQKDRRRAMLTELGLLEWSRDYYKNVNTQEYCYPLDELTGVRAYERIGDTVSAKLVNEAADVSYAKSSAIVTGGTVSRQTVRNKLLKLAIPEKEMPERKPYVRELHVYADEDHVHMQKPGKQKGKQNQIVPVVTVSEGVKPVCQGRNALISPMHFVDEEFDTERLWGSVSGYISKTYDAEKLEKIYVHGDGGGWIKKGLLDFAQAEHVMDKFHFFKRLKALSRKFPAQSVQARILNALEKNDREYADRILHGLAANSENEKACNEALEFGTFVFGHWEEIRSALRKAAGGSCTEGQVSHVLSERFSRDPLGWSKEGLGKLTKVRVSVKNGRPIEADDFKLHERPETYAQYADRLIEESMQGAIDWSIFEVTPPVFDGVAGTQVLIHAFGENRGVLN